MPRCAQCGDEHEVLDPAFRRPEPFVLLDGDLREAHTKANDDICTIALPGAEARYFVRGTLPVEVAGYADGVWWGLWAEVSEATFSRIVELWTESDQASEPPFEGRLANVIPSYPDTMDLPLAVQLTGPTSRPEFRFAVKAAHPFVSECAAGVDAHRAAQWGSALSGAR